MTLPNTRGIRRTLGLLLPLAAALSASAQGGVEVSGELRRWHPVTITFDGPSTSEDAPTNPFLDYRLNVTVTAPSGARHVVPGYFAADGDAGNTSATSGNAWRAHFTPSETGSHTFVASFRTGAGVAVSLAAGAGSPTGFDGTAGSFTVAETNKAAPDFRGRGVLRYVGEHYLRFDDGSYFVKGGAGSPENFLGYYEFDGTEDHGGDNGDLPSDGLHHYDPHLGDWRSGDPTWQGGKGKRIIGAVNYLASEGVDSQYFLTLTVGGDGRDVYPFTAYDTSCDGDACRRYDVSKLAQWDVVFRHMQAKGILLHVVTQETENDHLLDDGDLGTARKLYYRELVARFGYHPALVWNLGEETSNTVSQLEDFAEYIRALDPYDHPIVVHTFPDELEDYYEPLLDHPAFLGASIQLDAFYDGYDKPEEWVRRSADAGRPWIVTTDESGGASVGCTPDGTGNNHVRCRNEVLWANLFAGGAGVEWYFGYGYPHGDLDLEDFRSRNRLWDYARFAVGFVEEHLPFTVMHTVDAVDLGADDETFLFVEDATDGGWARAAAYIADGTDSFDIPPGTYELRWFDPRNGGGLQVGETSTLEGGSDVSLGGPPNSPSEDWVALLTRTDTSDEPNIDASPSPLDFGAVVLGEQATRALRLRNTGSQPLTVTDIDLTGNAAFSLVAPPATPFTLGPGQERSLNVRFAPTALGSHAAALAVDSNDPDTPTLTVPVSGTGVEEGGDVAVVGFTLVDADSDEDLGPLVDGATLDLSVLPPHLNVRANTIPGEVGSVHFTLNGENYALENDAPYALAGDTDGDYHAWSLDLGEHVLTATPYGEPGGGGEAGVPLSVGFSIVLATPTEPPTHSTGPALYPISPNPARGDATLTFDLPEASPVRVSLFNALGAQVAVLVDALMPPGRHTLTLPLGRLASGLYVCRLAAGEEVRVEKVLVVR